MWCWYFSNRSTSCPIAARTASDGSAFSKLICNGICMNSLSSRRGSESGEAPIEELIRVSHPRVGYACQVCVVGLPRSESRRSALPLPKLPEDLRFSKAEALFARIEQLVDQVLFNSTVPSQ